jgi:hypothetical protein
VSDQSPTPQNPGQPYGEQPFQQPYPQQPSPQQPNPQQPYAQQPYPQQPYGQQPYQQGGEQVQPYAQPYGQYPQSYALPYAAPARPTNTMAIVSLVSSLVGLFIVPIVGSIIAVITGPMGRRQIRETGENGDGMALAGTIVGWAGLGLWILGGLLFLIPFIFFAATATTTG